MKKLKIFLMLSILLCLGFVLTSEVHAQGVIELTQAQYDALSQGETWVLNENQFLEQYPDYFYFTVTFTSNGKTYNKIYFDLEIDPSLNPNYGIWYYGVENNHVYEANGWLDQAYRTITFETTPTGDLLTWLEANATQIIGPFEVGDTLPAGYIKISWDFTDKPIPEETMTFVVSSGDDFFNDFIIQIDFQWGTRRVTQIFYEGSIEFIYVDTPGFTIIELTEPCEITDIDGTTGATSVDYNVYIGGSLTWEVVSQDYFDGFMSAREFYGFREIGGYWISGEQAWNNGYDSGSEETWDEGFEYGMETFGYYDPITDQWLSVEEYLDLYGTDKPGQSDFYKNFDKYFIPAMIIVFGGAIVLTILKVFKGRE